MKRQTLLVSGAVAGLCAAVLVLFTDIEESMVRWFNCGPLATQTERDSRICR